MPPLTLPPGAPEPSRLGALRDAVRNLPRHLGYMVCAVLVGWFVFAWRCRLKVHLAAPLHIRRNTLVVINHRTLLDGHLVTVALFGNLRLLPRYHLLPHHAAAAENYLNTPLKRFIFGFCCKCLPIRRKGEDPAVLATLDILCRHLRAGTLNLCPEGTRTRTGEIRKGRWGTGYVIYHARPQVIPVFHRGAERVMPVGARRLSYGHDIEVYAGKPMDLEKFYAMPDCMETWDAIAQVIMVPLRELERAHPPEGDDRDANPPVIRQTHEIPGDLHRGVDRVRRSARVAVHGS